MRLRDAIRFGILGLTPRDLSEVPAPPPSFARHKRASVIAQEAAEWFARMRYPSVSLHERRQFGRWLKLSVTHVAEYLRMARLHSELAEVSVGEVLTRLEAKTQQTLLQAAIVTPLAHTREGALVQAVALPWIELVMALEHDPDIVHQLHWRKWEEIVAAAYEREGFEVVLTPRSNDRGRDVIAVHREIGTIRIFDQVKAYAPGHLVTANDVRAMLGVLTADSNVSKGFVTTTSSFAPGILKDPGFTALMPYRLELRSRKELISWLAAVKNRDPRALARNRIMVDDLRPPAGINPRPSTHSHSSVPMSDRPDAAR